MAQLDGKTVRAYLSRSDADPAPLLGLDADCKAAPVGGPIVEAYVTGVLIQTEGGRRFVRAIELDRWMLQEVSPETAEGIEAAVLGMPASSLCTLRENGFDPIGLAPTQAELIVALIETVRSHREAEFEMVETTGLLLGAPTQYGAARRLLETVMSAPFVRASGSARIHLAGDASSKGDVRRVRSLTETALPCNRLSSSLTEDARGILLNIRAACFGRFASRCSDVKEARDAANAAFAILGKREHLTNTYSMLRKRADALRCGWA